MAVEPEGFYQSKSVDRRRKFWIEGHMSLVTRGSNYNGESCRGTIPRRFLIIVLSLLFITLLATACKPVPKTADMTTTIVLKHGVISGRGDLFRQVLDIFERENQGIKVRAETLPSSSDEQHQFYVINLEGQSRDFDVLSIDVIWMPEFARAGWLRDLSHLLAQSERNDFFPGPLEAVTYRGSIYGVPWYVDAGVLFYRKDLLDKHALPVPRTWQQLVSASRYVMEREPGMYGFVWQGKQYEGLVCNILEYLWSAGGGIDLKRESTIDSRQNRQALAFARDLITVYKVTPALVNTADEEMTRLIFGSGRALFMRNWPEAYSSFEREGSTLKGKVRITHLPSFPGMTPHAALGGWQLGVNRYSRSPEAAEKLVRFLTSRRIQKELALRVGYQPARRSLYFEEDFKRRLPFVSGLYATFMDARPRPVTPYYMMLTQVLQSEFSAVMAGIRSPEAALSSAEVQIAKILRIER